VNTYGHRSHFCISDGGFEFFALFLPSAPPPLPPISGSAVVALCLRLAFFLIWLNSRRSGSLLVSMSERASLRAAAAVASLVGLTSLPERVVCFALLLFDMGGAGTGVGGASGDTSSSSISGKRTLPS
jgi:hypothetical protein